MKHAAAFQTPRLLLHTTVTALIGLALIAPVAAQDSETPEVKGARRSSSSSRGAAGASERGRERKQSQSETAPKQAELYPQATRKDPNIKATNKGGKALREIIAAFDAKKADEVIAKVETLVADSSMNAYDKGFAYQIAANVEADRDPPNYAKAVDYYQKAIATDGLDNNGHYQMLYNLAVMQNELEKHAEALTSIDRFLNETKAEKPEAISFKAYLLSELQRPAEAAALYEQTLARNPNDKATLMNAVALYQQAGNDKRVKELLDIARSKNMLTTDSEYRTLYVPLINAGKLAEAVALIDEGIAKGAIKPSQKLANDYAVIAQTYYGDENTAKAIEMYRRAAAASDNGEASLNLARVLRNENRIAEAKQAAQQALNKGLKKPEDAKKILALPGK